MFHLNLLSFSFVSDTFLRNYSISQSFGKAESVSKHDTEYYPNSLYKPLAQYQQNGY